MTYTACIAAIQTSAAYRKWVASSLRDAKQREILAQLMTPFELGVIIAASGANERKSRKPRRNRDAG